MWADTFHAGMRTPAEVSSLVAAARAANCNAILAEVRKRGDAYYRNGLEPIATDVADAFDPLADLIQKAHTGTPRVEVHAWLVTYNIWNKETTTPSQPTHPYNLHPDWVTQNDAGAKWDGGNYQLDPGHPGVQAHTFDVAMDVLARYDIDGLHFDYIRYSERGSTINYQPWGYNPVAVERFKRQRNVTTTPAPGDAVWLQWRRDQVTALLRKVYLHAWANKPGARISAALIPWGTAPNLTLAAWKNTNAYARVLQDWRAWMEEGILDLACPMIYRTDNNGLTAWANFTKERQYSRAAAVGLGWYLNSIGNTIAQIKLARTLSSSGKNTAGVLGYSYAVPNADNVSRSETWEALTDNAAAETYDPGGAPVFASAVPTPAMPWKTTGTKGHLMGYVRDGAETSGLDGVTVTISGPITRILTTDASGFFGAVDLPAGTYTIRVAPPGYAPAAQFAAVTARTVAQRILRLQTAPFAITSAVRAPATNSLTITWNSRPGLTYRVEGCTDLPEWTPVATSLGSAGTSTTYRWPMPSAWQARAFVRVVEEP